MANLKEIKSHIKSVSDTQKITNAMYLIASTKMRSAKSLYTAHIPYFNMLESEIKRISSGINEKECPYIAQKQGTVAVLIIASDKGMCGDYNKSVIKAAEEAIKKYDVCKIYLIGEKLKKYFSAHNISYIEDFDFTIKSPDSNQANEIADYFCSRFISGEFGKVISVFAKSNPNGTYKVAESQLLPISIEKTDSNKDYEYFPSKSVVIDNLIPQYISSQFYTMIIQSFFSEQNARMMAMDNANKNARDMIAELTLLYNHTRQNAITQEITELSSERKKK